jgi:hypothetical protein
MFASVQVRSTGKSTFTTSRASSCTCSRMWTATAPSSATTSSTRPCRIASG